MKYSEEMSDQLNDLLEKNYDTEKNFKSAADDVENLQLKTLFQEMAQQRYDFGHELKAEIRNFGEEPDKGSSASSDISRGWMDLKAALSGNKEQAVLKQLVKGEEAALEEYNKVIKETNFPPTTENLLIKQRNAIMESMNKAKTLHESFDNV